MRWSKSKNARATRGSVFDVIVKIVTLFLIGMGVLAMFGKLRLPGSKRLTSKHCPKCGAPRVGRGPCPCGHKG